MSKIDASCHCSTGAVVLWSAMSLGCFKHVDVVRSTDVPHCAWQALWAGTLLRAWGRVSAVLAPPASVRRVSHQPTVPGQAGITGLLFFPFPAAPLASLVQAHWWLVPSMFF